MTSINIINLLGQLIYSQQIYPSDGEINETFNIENIPAGISEIKPDLRWK